jgi:hypothetical protein
VGRGGAAPDSQVRRTLVSKWSSRAAPALGAASWSSDTAQNEGQCMAGEMGCGAGDGVGGAEGHGQGKEGREREGRGRAGWSGVSEDEGGARR